MKEITIGRNQDNTIVIEGDNKVSGHHCRCYESNGKYFIQDCNSLNGVYVNDERISEPTEMLEDSKIVIVSKTFSGGELIACIQKKGDKASDKCLSIEKQYIGLETRYHNNVQMLCQVLHIESVPYRRMFDSLDEEIAFDVEEYNRKMDEAIQMLRLVSKSSQADVIVFHDDMDALAALCRGVADSKEKAECLEIRQRVFDKVNHLQKQLHQQIAEAIEKFTTYYQVTFEKHYETSTTKAEVWKTIKNEQLVTTPYILYGVQRLELPLFDQLCVVDRLQFVPFLKRNNIIVRYDNNKRQEAQTLVNGIIGRIFASSKSGNVLLHMTDIKDLGGTSNILKMLDKHVYTIDARIGDIQSLLAQLDRSVEDIIQNLLFGPYSSLEKYNQGKEKQEPYHIVVFKDFPLGITQESAYTIQRILVNGAKAGVHFIFMLNEDCTKGEDCQKIAHILHLTDAKDALRAAEINLTTALDEKITEKYATIDDELMNAVVQYVNAGFEMKKDEILRLTDYMIPKSEWWTKHSASRADIPFGMATNKQIQKINITQESGQNCAVVIGIPGSGKSVFLHVLIANAMVNYSPRELQMYLLDFSGVEFDVYARHKLPHARVIAPEAEREFGLSILREVFEEGNRRMTLCRENGVTNIVELKQKNPNLVVPRLLVIIDEFQKIFEIENDKISQEANAKIHAIIQEYRKFGINLILATQKLPAKSIVPYDLIANRIVFKSDPNDFNNLIKWSHSTPQPRLLTGNCVYNNESGAEMSNYLTRSFFINASGELEKLIDDVAAFAQAHPEMTDDHELRTFRSDELPEFVDRILSDRHIEHQDAPREVGVYMGESIAIAPCHVYVPLTKDSNNNILIIGGRPDVAKGIAYHTLLSEVAGHNEKTCNVILMNFMMEDDPMQSVFDSDMYAVISEFCNLQEAKSPEDVKDYLQFVKEEVIDARKADPSLPLTHFFINIFDFQRGRMFDGTGSRGDMQSECARLLEYILKNGPMVGVFTVLQVDNLANLSRLGYGAQNMFCHRIALQMSEQDSDKVVGSQAANKLLVLNRPATNFRGLYYNNVNNSITKFKPYRYGSNSNQ